MNWLLPEHLSDALPGEALKIECLRRDLLDLFYTRGFELIMPPMVEYLEPLLTGAGQDLDLQTFRLSDQISGRTLGIRADMTPQAARIDAHLLNRQGVARLCYCGSVLRSLPSNLFSSREPIQIGAEIYGYKGFAADLEILRLAAAALSKTGLSVYRVDLGHIGLFQTLIKAAQIDTKAGETLFSLLQCKDIPGLKDFCARFPLPWGKAFLDLASLYGEPGVLERAKAVLPDAPEISRALETLSQLVAALPDLPLSIDLSDLRGYHYHNGIMFAAYCSGSPSAIMLGGRYDGAGKSFGRERPATGFSMDLRELAQIFPGGALDDKGPIYAASAKSDAALLIKIAQLRKAGEIVIELLPDEAPTDCALPARSLVRENQGWVVKPGLPENSSGK